MGPLQVDKVDRDNILDDSPIDIDLEIQCRKKKNIRKYSLITNYLIHLFVVLHRNRELIKKCQEGRCLESINLNRKVGFKLKIF